MNSFDDILQEMSSLHKSKNADYGNSFDKLLDILKDDVPAEIVFFIRASDKLNRIKSLAKKEASVKEEKLYDTVIDLANYSAMFAMWLKENEMAKK